MTNQEIQQQAKSCPFCGSQNIGREGTLHGAYAIACYSCSSSGPLAKKENIALDKWNKRFLTSPTGATPDERQ